MLRGWSWRTRCIVLKAMSIAQLLRALPVRPCHDVLEWAEKLPPRITPRGAWELCGDPSYLAGLVSVLDQQEGVRLSCVLARHVLPVWEAQHPDDMRPRRAIEVAEAWLAGGEGITEQRDYYDFGYADDAADSAAEAANAAARGTAHVADLRAANAVNAAMHVARSASHATSREEVLAIIRREVPWAWVQERLAGFLVDAADAGEVVDVLLVKSPAGAAPLLDVGDLPDEALAFVARLLRGDHDALLAVKAFTIMERRDADR